MLSVMIILTISFQQATMRGEKRKSSYKKIRQEVNINWILSSQEPTPITFFRLTHPTARTRAFEKYRKCFNLALDRSEGDKLDRLRAVNNDEETLQRDWETWLKEKKAILACRANHDTSLLIQQDFASTMTNIVGIDGAIKSDDNKENDFDNEEHSNRKRQLEEMDDEELNNEMPVASAPSVMKKARSEDHDVDEDEDIYIRAVHLAHKETTSEIKDIFKKIVSLRDRILQYRIINLSMRSAANPFHKVLTDGDKKLLKDIWISLEPSESGKINTARYKKWELEVKPLISTYHNHLEIESVFDDICLDNAIEAVAMKPYNGVFNYKKHYELNWVQDIYRRFLMIFMAPINQLLDPEQTEFSYRENFINPIFAKVFDDLMELIHMRTGEIENMLIKTQRIETRVRTQRLSLGCRQDDVIIVNVNGTSVEVGFMEVVGSAVYDDLTKLSDDLEKVLKCMQISLFYQRQHHLQRGASEEQLQILESYGIIVYKRTATIYTMHCSSGLYIVDKLTEFFIPNSKDQLHVLKEVIEKVYMFKSRVMDYYLKLSKLTPNFTHTYVKVDELPTTASPSRKKNVN